MLKNTPFYISDYYRYEKEFLDISTHICIDDQQLNVYSLVLADLIINIFSNIEGISKELYAYITDIFLSAEESAEEKEKLEQYEQKNPSAAFYIALDYLDKIWFLSAKELIISSDSIYISKYNRILTPFKDFNNKNKDNKDSVSSCFNAYSAIKHNRIKDINLATVKNALTSLGILFILCTYAKYLPENENEAEDKLEIKKMLTAPNAPVIYNRQFTLNESSQLFTTKPYVAIFKNFKKLSKLRTNDLLDANNITKSLFVIRTNYDFLYRTIQGYLFLLSKDEKDPTKTEQFNSRYSDLLDYHNFVQFYKSSTDIDLLSALEENKFNIVLNIFCARPNSKKNLGYSHISNVYPYAILSDISIEERRLVSSGSEFFELFEEWEKLRKSIVKNGI